MAIAVALAVAAVLLWGAGFAAAIDVLQLVAVKIAHDALLLIENREGNPYRLEDPQLVKRQHFAQRLALPAVRAQPPGVVVILGKAAAGAAQFDPR
jgi:hypothetical protein